MASSGMLRRVALVRTDVSEELSASFIRVTRIGELGTTLKPQILHRNFRSHRCKTPQIQFLYLLFLHEPGTDYALALLTI
jgi:hypothetical protein